jgi:hypothetical protein
MSTELNRTLWLFEFDETEPVEEAEATDEAMTILGEVGHEADWCAMPPTANLNLDFVNIIWATLPGDYARYG